MADLLDELKDDIKQERYERLITVHGPKLLIIASVIVVLTAVYKLYQNDKYNSSVEQGRVFYDAFEGKAELHDEVIASDHEGFKILSSFSKAGVSNSKGDEETAIKTLEGLNNLSGSNKAIAEYAKLASLSLIANSEDKWKGQEADLNSKFEKLYTSNSPFSLSAKQAHAIFLNKIGEKDKARSLFSDIALQDGVPPSITERARKFIKIMDSEK